MGGGKLGHDDSRMLSNLRAAANREPWRRLPDRGACRLRYDGGIATGTDNHALNIGLRMSW
jgi:hypothetical protein